MSEDEHLLIILHEVPKSGEPERRARIFWRDPNASWLAANAMGDGLAVLKRHVRTFVEAIDVLEERHETASSARDYFELLQSAAPLLRTTRNLHKTLQEAREAAPNDRDLIALRDQCGDLERALDLLQADAQNGVTFTIAKQSEQQAEMSQHIAASSHRLNKIAALTLPLTAITSVFGMNFDIGFKGGPLLFWAVLIGALGVGWALRAALDKTSAE